MLLMQDFFYFIYTDSLAITKCDIINSNMHRKEHNLVMAG